MFRSILIYCKIEIAEIIKSDVAENQILPTVTTNFRLVLKYYLSSDKL